MKKLIFGYGVTGKTVEQYFQKSNINYLIYDENKELNLPTELVFEPSRFSEIDEVIISPGVKPSNSLLEQFYLILETDFSIIPQKSDITFNACSLFIVLNSEIFKVLKGPPDPVKISLSISS